MSNTTPWGEAKEQPGELLWAVRGAFIATDEHGRKVWCVSATSCADIERERNRLSSEKTENAAPQTPPSSPTTESLRSDESRVAQKRVSPERAAHLGGQDQRDDAQSVGAAPFHSDKRGESIDARLLEMADALRTLAAFGDKLSDRDIGACADAAAVLDGKARPSPDALKSANTALAALTRIRDEDLTANEQQRIAEEALHQYVGQKT